LCDCRDSVLTLVQITFAESVQDLAKQSAQPALGVKNGLLLEARFERPLSRNEEAALRAMDHFKECEA
jgi:hypothetical protein